MGLPETVDLGPSAREWDGLSRLGAVVDGSARFAESRDAVEIGALLQALEGAQGGYALMRLRPWANGPGPAASAEALRGAAAAAWGVNRAPFPPAVHRGGLVLAVERDAPWEAVVAAARHALGGSPLVASFVELGDGASPAAALALADGGITQALEKGLDFVKCSAEEERARADEAAVAESLVASLRSGEGLRLVVQPAYDARTRRVVGAEMLLRHRSQELGSIGPAEFLPIAERAGILADVERWVLDASLETIGAWWSDGRRRVPVSVNVAPVDFLAPAFVAELGERLERFAVEPAALVVEVAEAGLVGRIDAACARIQEVQALGVAVALDDVGASDSGLAELRRLPVDAIKVHRSFVLGMEREPGLAALVRGVLSLAGALGIRTVAAGVETESQLAALVEQGCGAVQGYLLSPPLELDGFRP